MNDDELKKIILSTIDKMLSKLPTPADRLMALEVLLHESYVLARKYKGDGFASGWLAGALREFKAGKPDDSTGQPHCIQRCDAFPQTSITKH